MATLNIFKRKNQWRERVLTADQYLRSVQFTPVRMGTLTAGLLIIFLIVVQGLQMRLDLIWLPMMNCLFFIPGIYYTLKSYGEPGTISYFSGLKCGALTALIGSLIYLLYILLNYQLQPQLYVTGGKATSFTVPLNGLPSMFCLFFETLVGGIIMTYCFMQFFKKED